MTIFHERLRILYENARDRDHRVGRKAFAEQCGLSPSLIDNYLNGSGWPTLDNFCKICDRLHVNASWMIGQSEIKYNFETRFAELADELSEAQMEAVEEYVSFLKYAARRREKKNTAENVHLPE